MKKFGIGQPLLRKEDLRFISGKGQYTGDIFLENETFMYVLRSNIAHGSINNIDIEEAKNAEGVLSIFTGEDLKKDGIKDIDCWGRDL